MMEGGRKPGRESLVAVSGLHLLLQATIGRPTSPDLPTQRDVTTRSRGWPATTSTVKG